MRADMDAPPARKVKRIYTIDDIDWLMYPDEKRVVVCTLDSGGNLTSECIDEAGELSGADVLPGLTLPLSKIFEKGV